MENREIKVTRKNLNLLLDKVKELLTKEELQKIVGYLDKW